MRRLVVAAIALGLALLLAGCGGGGAEPATTTSNTAGATGGGSGSTSTLPDFPDLSQNESSTFEPFPTGSSVPADLQEKINANKQNDKATLIYFFDSTQKTSEEVRDTIDAVRNENRYLADLVAYDIGKYVSVRSNGSIVIDPALAESSSAKAAVTLARDPAIDVSLTPFIVLVDTQGYITYKHHGLIDYAFLEREVQRAAR